MWNTAEGKLAMNREERIALALGCALWFVAGLVAAQEPTPPADAASPTKPAAALAMPPDSPQPDPDKRSPLDAIPVAVRYLPNKLGELIPVLANATWESYVEFITNPPSAKRETAPAAAVSSIELTGEADDERALLTSRLGEIGRAHV